MRDSKVEDSGTWNENEKNSPEKPIAQRGGGQIRRSGQTDGYLGDDGS